MRVTKKLRSELELLDSLQRITGYKNIKNSKEKSPRTILLQKISSSNDNNFPIKVQLLKTKSNNFNKNLYNTNSNSNSVGLKQRKIPFPKNSLNYFNRYEDQNENNIKEINDSKNNMKQLKGSFVINSKTNINKNISESPISNIKYKNSTYKSINQSPIQKVSDNNLNIYNNENDFENSEEHKIRNVLSKNLAYNRKKPNSAMNSPNVCFASFNIIRMSQCFCFKHSNIHFIQSSFH